MQDRIVYMQLDRNIRSTSKIIHFNFLKFDAFMVIHNINYASLCRAGTCERVAEAIAGFPGARRMFIGHTTTQSLAGSREPLVYCDGTLYAVDVGISRWMSNNPVNMQLEVDEAGQTVRFDVVRTPIDGAGQLLVPVEATENTPKPRDGDEPPIAYGNDGSDLLHDEAASGDPVAVLLLVGGVVLAALTVSSKRHSLDPKQSLTSKTWRVRVQERKYARIASEDASGAAEQEV